MGDAIPFLRITGSPKERGRQYGERARDKVHRAVEIYDRWFRDFVNVSWERAREEAKQYVDLIGSYDDEIMEEIEGIAEGAGVDVLDVVILNSRTEVSYGLLPGCTALAATAEAADNGHTIIGQNWDWMPETMGIALLIEIQQPGRPTVLTLTEAGMVGKIGVNSAGLGLCVNLLASDNNQKGTPWHVIARGILNSEMMADAIWAVARTRRAGSGNYLIAHAAGEAVDIESNPLDYHVIYAGRGYLAHSNHFLSTPLRVRDRVKELFPDTFLRYYRANRFLERASPHISLETFTAILRDHFSFPDSICRHPDDRDPESLRIQTNVSVLFDLTEKSMLYTMGPPCTRDYIRFSFAHLGWSRAG